MSKVLKISTLAALSIAMVLNNAAPADAQTINCQVSGVLLVIATNGPVTLCSVDTSDMNSNDMTVDIPVLSPNL